eukprot:CAMPEP_0113696462 /NCGR_PEP_ID=MMETSP0038_2-20120614/21509_1 /TAXON_ID=2898 /ORGANISM="Cryptomonas paramecium" /LENGTH=81 /DNA_ID=CAMNT_0000619199 /DNA_START=147 /DNA_END=389 /DNA_ORIENTATION=+ /assembly_acc=CAM_ASM_000170
MLNTRAHTRHRHPSRIRPLSPGPQELERAPVVADAAARVVHGVAPVEQQGVDHAAPAVAQAPQLPVPGLHADPVPVVVELQ